MKRIGLPNKDWRESLQKLKENLTKYPRDEKTLPLSNAVSECSQYYKYLKAIWRRIIADFDLYTSYLSIMEKYMKKGEGKVELEPQDDLVLDSLLQNMVYLKLDYETFFIYAKILMDKLAYLTSFFFGGPSDRSFSKHRDFFLRTENIPFSLDEEYASHIRDKTDWFERSLKLPRDKIIEHSLPFIGAIKSSRNGTITLPKLGLGRDLQKVGEDLKTLKKKYEDKYPGLKGISDNIFEITKFLLDRPDIVLETKDRKIFSECVRIAGSELPDISSIADNIIAFVKFFGEHFAKEYCARQEKHKNRLLSI